MANHKTIHTVKEQCMLCTAYQYWSLFKINWASENYSPETNILIYYLGCHCVIFHQWMLPLSLVGHDILAVSLPPSTNIHDSTCMNRFTCFVVLILMYRVDKRFRTFTGPKLYFYSVHFVRYLVFLLDQLIDYQWHDIRTNVFDTEW